MLKKYTLTWFDSFLIWTFHVDLFHISAWLPCFCVHFYSMIMILKWNSSFLINCFTRSFPTCSVKLVSAVCFYSFLLWLLFFILLLSSIGAGVVCCFLLLLLLYLLPWVGACLLLCFLLPPIPTQTRHLEPQWWTSCTKRSSTICFILTLLSLL